MENNYLNFIVKGILWRDQSPFSNFVFHVCSQLLKLTLLMFQRFLRIANENFVKVLKLANANHFLKYLTFKTVRIF